MVAIIGWCFMVTNVREGKKYQWDESRGNYYRLVFHGCQCEGGRQILVLVVVSFIY